MLLNARYISILAVLDPYFPCLSFCTCRRTFKSTKIYINIAKFGNLDFLISSVMPVLLKAKNAEEYRTK